MIWVAFDTETTGVDPGSRLVELAAIAFDDDGMVKDVFTSLIHPGMPIPPDATAANGLTNTIVSEAPQAAEILTRFLSWLPSESVMIAHNARFDLGIISWECQRAGLPLPTNQVVDTKHMAQRLRDANNCKLQTLVQHHCIATEGDAHRALPDADAVRQYFQIARKRTTPTVLPWTTSYSYTATLPKPCADLPQWVACGQSTRFAYRNQQEKKSWPTVIPYGWATFGSGKVMMHGWCEWACGRRYFDVSRVSL
jgi:DNA polymerase III epsilon subunit-like protein